MFKIVQQTKYNALHECTMEKTLTVVPSAWEKNGVLMWPSCYKWRYIQKMRKDASSTPDRNWQALTCVVKKSCETYEEAEKMCNEMSDTSDQEEEENVFEIKSELLLPNNIENGGFITNEALLDQNGQSFTIPKGYILIKEELYKSLLDTNRLLLNKLDVIANLMQSQHPNDNVPMMIPQKTFQPLKTTEEMRAMDDQLGSDPAYWESWLNYLCETFGKDGRYLNEGNGCAHVLIDKLFCRILLTKVSWTGVARPQSRESTGTDDQYSSNAGSFKTAMCSHQNIIRLFAAALKYADNSITIERVEKFLKQILNNSGSRARPRDGPRRMPHTKKRRVISE